MPNVNPQEPQQQQKCQNCKQNIPTSIPGLPVVLLGFGSQSVGNLVCRSGMSSALRDEILILLLSLQILALLPQYCLAQLTTAPCIEAILLLLTKIQGFFCVNVSYLLGLVEAQGLLVSTLEQSVKLVIDIQLTFLDVLLQKIEPTLSFNFNQSHSSGSLVYLLTQHLNLISELCDYTIQVTDCLLQFICIFE